jgi:CRISPR/Cas system CMR-associated protein Cmr5 small subunit
MAIKYYVKAAVDEYKDKDGNLKKKYASIGVILETKNGLMLKLETMPFFSLKDGCLIAYLNEPEPVKDAFPKSLADISDDVPF